MRLSKYAIAWIAAAAWFATTLFIMTFGAMVVGGEDRWCYVADPAQRQACEDNYAAIWIVAVWGGLGSLAIAISTSIWLTVRSLARNVKSNV